MMKAIFIQPVNEQIVPAELSDYETELLETYCPPPLGMMSVATCINKWTEHQARVIDARILGMHSKALECAVRRERPDVVGLPSVTFTLLSTLKAAQLIKKIDRDIPVVMGGIHANLYPFQTVELGDVDFALRGDGEAAFIRLLEHLEGKRDLRHLPGIVGVKNGKPVRGKPPEFITDLDALPLVDRTLTPYDKYASVLSQRNPCTIATGSRGCTYRCSFCYLPLRCASLPFRKRSPQSMVEEMRACADLGIKEVLFYDDTFTLERPRIMEFSRLLEEADLDITWDIRTRADCIDRELLLEMKRAGLRRLQIGVESGTQEGLDSIQKDLTLKQIEDAFSAVKGVGLDSLGYFMLGLPGETRDMMMETISFARRLDPDYAVFAVYMPFPGTPAWNRILAQGNTSLRDAWERFIANPVPHFNAPTCNEHHSKEELFEFVDFAYKSFYLRPKVFFREVRRIRSLKELMLRGGIVAEIISSVGKDALRRRPLPDTGGESS